MPNQWKEATVALRIETVLGGIGWTNQQMNVSVSRARIQSIDVNHREILLDQFF